MNEWVHLCNWGIIACGGARREPQGDSDLFNPEGVQIESLFRAESAGVFLVPRAESADSTHGSDDRETQLLAHARKEQQSKTHTGKRTLHKRPLGLFAKA